MEENKMSSAAIEVLDSITLLATGLASTTHDYESSRLLQTLVGCRLVELLEIYIRRVLELIFNHDSEMWSVGLREKILLHEALNLSRAQLIERAREADAQRIAGRFDQAQDVLAKYLQVKPFSPEQLEEFIKLKEQRNLFVHNNGLVDHAYAEKFPEVRVGDKLEYDLHIIESLQAIFSSVIHIDQILIKKYPLLGQEADDISEVVLQRMSKAMIIMQPTGEESAKLNQVIPAIGARASAFTLPDQITSGMISGLGTLWIIQERNGIYLAVSVEKRYVGTFENRELLVAWITQEFVSWEGLEISDVTEDFVEGHLGNLSIRWPKSLMDKEKQIGRILSVPTEKRNEN